MRKRLNVILEKTSEENKQIDLDLNDSDLTE
jgi:hypothetical protein